MGFEVIRPSFAGGELAPTLAGRVDITKYHIGVRKLKNFLVHRHGGISNRPGTEFMGYIKNKAKKAVLIPFVFSREESYMIEAGEGYFRFFTDGGQIINSTGLPYEVGNTYNETDIFNLRTAQSADTMYLACKDRPPKQLIRYGQTAWELLDFSFREGPFLTGKSMDNHLMIQTNSVVVVPAGFNEYRTPGSYGLYIPLGVTQVNIVLTGGTASYYETETGFRTYHENGKPSSFGSLSANGQSYNSGDSTKTTGPDTLILSNVDVTPNSWVSVVVGKGGDRYNSGQNWHAGAPGYVQVSWPQQLSQQTTGKMWAKIGMFRPEHVGSVWKIRQQVPSQKIYYPNTLGVRCFSQWNVETSGYWAGTLRVERQNKLTGGWELIKSMTSSKDRNYTDSGSVDEPQMIRIIGENFVAGAPPNTQIDGYMYGKAVLETMPTTYDGIVKVIQYVHPGEVIVEIQKEVAVENTWTEEWSEGAWSQVNGYPTCVTFFQDRLVFGGSRSEPFGMFLSRPGDYNNFGTSLPSKESDAIFRRMLSRVSGRVNSITPIGDLLTLTTSGEFRVGPNGDGAISPTNFDAKPQGNIGSANLEPVQIGSSLLYVQSGNSTIVDMGYSFEADGYMGSDLTVLASHLFKDHKIVTMAYQREPDSILWVVRDDGIALGLTYMKEQEIIAWHRHETVGKIEWVEVIPHEKGYDEVYFIVQRELNGEKVRCVERLKERMPNDDINEAFFVDCGLSYRGEPKMKIFGLDHLANQEVSILADGRVQPKQTVRQFTVQKYDSIKETTEDIEVWGIELSRAASVVHVGLGIHAEMETLPIEIASKNMGTMQGKVKKISKVNTLFHNSLGGYLSVDNDDESKEFEFKSDSLNRVIGEQEKPYSGYKALRPDKGYSEDGKIKITQIDPLPMTILAIVPDITMGG